MLSGAASALARDLFILSVKRIPIIPATIRTLQAAREDGAAPARAGAGRATEGGAAGSRLGAADATARVLVDGSVGMFDDTQVVDPGSYMLDVAAEAERLLYTARYPPAIVKVGWRRCQCRSRPRLLRCCQLLTCLAPPERPPHAAPQELLLLQYLVDCRVDVAYRSVTDTLLLEPVPGNPFPRCTHEFRTMGVWHQFWRVDDDVIASHAMGTDRPAALAAGAAGERGVHCARGGGEAEQAQGRLSRASVSVGAASEAGSGSDDSDGHGAATGDEGAAASGSSGRGLLASSAGAAAAPAAGHASALFGSREAVAGVRAAAVLEVLGPLLRSFCRAPLPPPRAAYLVEVRARGLRPCPRRACAHALPRQWSSLLINSGRLVGSCVPGKHAQLCPAVALYHEVLVTGDNVRARLLLLLLRAATPLPPLTNCGRRAPRSLRRRCALPLTLRPRQSRSAWPGWLRSPRWCCCPSRRERTLWCRARARRWRRRRRWRIQCGAASRRSRRARSARSSCECALPPRAVLPHALTPPPLRAPAAVLALVPTLAPSLLRAQRDPSALRAAVARALRTRGAVSARVITLDASVTPVPSAAAAAGHAAQAGGAAATAAATAPDAAAGHWPVAFVVQYFGARFVPDAPAQAPVFAAPCALQLLARFGGVALDADEVARFLHRLPDAVITPTQPGAALMWATGHGPSGTPSGTPAVARGTPVGRSVATPRQALAAASPSSRPRPALLASSPRRRVSNAQSTTGWQPAAPRDARTGSAMQAYLDTLRCGAQERAAAGQWFEAAALLAPQALARGDAALLSDSCRVLRRCERASLLALPPPVRHAGMLRQRAVARTKHAACCDDGGSATAGAARPARGAHLPVAATLALSSCRHRVHLCRP